MPRPDRMTSSTKLLVRVSQTSLELLRSSIFLFSKDFPKWFLAFPILNNLLADLRKDACLFTFLKKSSEINLRWKRLIPFLFLELIYILMSLLSPVVS